MASPNCCWFNPARFRRCWSNLPVRNPRPRKVTPALVLPVRHPTAAAPRLPHRTHGPHALSARIHTRSRAMSNASRAHGDT